MGGQPLIGDLIYSRYKFFSYKTGEVDGFNIFSLTADGVPKSKKLVINFASGSDFLENIGTIQVVECLIQVNYLQTWD